MTSKLINQINIVAVVIGIPAYEVIKMIQDNKPVAIGKLRIKMSSHAGLLTINEVNMDPRMNKLVTIRISIIGT